MKAGRGLDAINRLICVFFGHKDILEDKRRLEDSRVILLYKCERCGQTSWLIIWEGKFGAIALWNRVLTADEIRTLAEIE